MKKKLLILPLAIVAFFSVSLVLFLNSNYYYSKKLVSAIREEDIPAVKQIIDKKPSCINTYPSVMSKWMQSAMDIRVCYPLNEACLTDNSDLIILLLENGADPNCNDGLTPLSITYGGKRDNWYENSVLLIEYNASLDYCTEYSGGNSSIFQDILKVRSGSTLPGYEAEDEEEVIQAFSYAIEHCNHDNINWASVLQYSVSNNRTKIVKMLLNNDYCNVNDTFSGMTALMFAARDATPEMVTLLLDYGADKQIKSSDGKTAYDYAMEKGYTEIAELLK